MGFIVEIDEISLVISEIDINGFLIGNTRIKIADILDIESSDRYQERLYYIFQNNLQLDQNRRVTIWDEGSVLASYFFDLIKEKKLVTFYFDEDDYVIGQLASSDETFILVNNITIEGEDDGISCHYIEKLIGLRYGGLEEQRIELLRQNRNK